MKRTALAFLLLLVPLALMARTFGAKFHGVLYVQTSTPTQLPHWPTF